MNNKLNIYINTFRKSKALSDLSASLLKVYLVFGLLLFSLLITELPNIREIIDQETYELQINSRAGIDILFGSDKQPKIGPLLDPEKDKERIEKLQ